MRVIFQISREAPPRLADHAKWSPALHDLIARCLQKARCAPATHEHAQPHAPALDHMLYAMGRRLDARQHHLLLLLLLLLCVS